jgi:hypothetical protein
MGAEEELLAIAAITDTIARNKGTGTSPSAIIYMFFVQNIFMRAQPN